MHYDEPTTQKVFCLQGDVLKTLELPGGHCRVDGFSFTWGDASIPMTPAYWASQTWIWTLEAPAHYQLGSTLEEELLACMLGGYGIPAEVGLAAYYRIRNEMIGRPDMMTDPTRLLCLLSNPLSIGNRSVRYRFAKQKARYIARAFASLHNVDQAAEDHALRNQLMELPGVGPKTASWIVRNHRGSDRVAILDIHILRVGRVMGFFDSELTVERHYQRLEDAYLRFAMAIGASASVLDSVIWMTARQLSWSKRFAHDHDDRKHHTQQHELAV